MEPFEKKSIPTQMQKTNIESGPCLSTPTPAAKLEAVGPHTPGSDWWHHPYHLALGPAWPKSQVPEVQVVPEAERAASHEGHSLG